MSHKLPPLPTLKQIMMLYNLKAQKQLAQNFLLDHKVTDRIVSRLPGNLNFSSVVEVGPGPGGLTRSLLKANCAKVIAVEKDQRFKPVLQMLQESVGNHRFNVKYDDMLKIDEAELLKGQIATKWDDPEVCPVQVIGNLPFNVATELLLKWLHQLPSRSGVFQWGRVPFTLMFQTEVAERIVARPGTKNYGRLSVMTQQSCEASTIMSVPGKLFIPPPKVDATVISIIPKINPVPLENLDSLELILREVFGMRRKMMRRAIRPIEEKLETNLLKQADIDGSLRPQDLTVAEWCRLADCFHKANVNNIIK